MELLVALGAGVLVIVLLVTALAIWRIGRVVSWRALAMTARATGSFEKCVAFIRFCARQQATSSRPLDRRTPRLFIPAPRSRGAGSPSPPALGEGVG